MLIVAPKTASRKATLTLNVFWRHPACVGYGWSFKLFIILYRMIHHYRVSINRIDHFCDQPPVIFRPLPAYFLYFYGNCCLELGVKTHIIVAYWLSFVDDMSCLTQSFRAVVILFRGFISLFSFIVEILKQNSLCLQDCIRVYLYLRDMELFAVVNDVYKEFFKQNPPARWENSIFLMKILLLRYSLFHAII